MMKRTFINILIGAMLCTACETEEITSKEAATLGDALGLSVSASDFEPVDPIAGTATRATENGANTTFEEGDRVGLIVLDENSNLVIDNAPYEYDGAKWAFDADNVEGKQPVYFAPLMRKYIVYYPYEASASGTTSVENLKKLDVFSVPTDQSSEEAYRLADLMTWETEGAAMKQINAELTHARASFSLAVNYRYKLATGKELDIPVLTALSEDFEDVFFYDKAGTVLTPYAGADNTFRYILPENFDGYLRWNYKYRKLTYTGEWENTSGIEVNTRYALNESLPTFEYTKDMAAVGDLYCVTEIDGQQVDYLFPNASIGIWDAEENECIGVVFKAGAGNGDNAGNYNEPIKSEGIHGYVVALEDAHTEKGGWGIPSRDEDLPNEESNSDNYNGYANTLIIRKRSEYNYTKVEEPTKTNQYWAFKVASEPSSTPEAPLSSSSWYLPSLAQLRDIYNMPNRTELLQAAGGQDFFTGTNAESGYWSSTEYNWTDAWFYYFNGKGAGAYAKGNEGRDLYPYRVRSVLTF